MSKTNQHKPPETLLDSPAFLQLIQSQHALADKLEQLEESIRTGPVDIAVANISRRFQEVPDHVIPGNTRVVLGSSGFGGRVTLSSGVPTKLVAANPNRLGGTVVVSGAGAVFLSLCTLEDQLSSNAIPQIWLTGSGGSWDFRLGNVLWCGTVVAVAAADSVITVAEV